MLSIIFMIKLINSHFFWKKKIRDGFMRKIIVKGFLNFHPHFNGIPNSTLVK